MKRKLFLLSLSLFLVCGCGKIPKLKNGEEAVVTFKDGKKISADELYETLKKDYALDATINLIDKTILETEFKGDIKDAEKYAESTIKSMRETYGSDDELLQAIQYYTSFSTIEAYQNYIYINYLQNKAAEEYAKTLVSDKDVKKYYDTVYFGDISINHILITPSVKSGATAEEQTKAEEAAKKKAEEVISKLDAAKKEGKDVKETFTALAKEYSDDKSTNKSGGALGYINLNKLDSQYDELVNEATKLKNGEYSAKVITTSLGYHVILKVDQKEKSELKKVEDDIRAILSKDTLTSDSVIVLKAMQHYRKEYDMEIIDSDIQSQYSKYMNYQLNKDSQQKSTESSKK